MKRRQTCGVFKIIYLGQSEPEVDKEEVEGMIKAVEYEKNTLRSQRETLKKNKEKVVAEKRKIEQQKRELGKEAKTCWGKLKAPLFLGHVLKK